jgi:anti-anti-sigma regulatory factor
MSKGLEINTRILEKLFIVELVGSIDEDADFSKILSTSVEGYVFDFNKVSMMNSCGIREWINFIDELPESCSIVYRNCPQVVIEQVNMVQGFLKAGARIDSFYAPYYSEDRDEVVKVLLKTESVINSKAPEIKDSTTGETLVFDAIEAQYFNFIKQQG